ncbi:hypothetical protein FSP39_010706 [Pinctada imbricata]|uniref:G-protein coupled receptors family 1 profile domain-containing protein n=1 Tax=Pinctada imbricata TaxID=66713 RepID=A0AA88YNG5_PINIB|nr:hypothetical protein FSP39_010706 [Pinctada imbricata]
MVEFRKYVVVGVFFISFVINAIALEALRRSRKLSYNVRILSINMVIADLILCASCIVFFFFAKSTTGIRMDENCMMTYIMAAACFWTYFATSFLVTAMAVDRFISLKFPFQYLKIVSEKRCKTSCYVIWIVSLLLATLFHVENREKFHQCYHELYKNNTYLTGLDNSSFITVGVTNLIILLINLFAYAAIIILVFRKKTFVSQGQRSLLQKLWTISLAYAILHGPFNLLTIVIAVFGIHENSTFIHVVILITSFVVFIDPILYTWRYKTCRYQVMMMLGCCCKGRVDAIRQRNNQFYCTYVIRSNFSSEESRLGNME